MDVEQLARKFAILRRYASIALLRPVSMGASFMTTSHVVVVDSPVTTRLVGIRVQIVDADLVVLNPFGRMPSRGLLPRRHADRQLRLSRLDVHHFQVVGTQLLEPLPVDLWRGFQLLLHIIINNVTSQALPAQAHRGTFPHT